METPHPQSKKVLIVGLGHRGYFTGIEAFRKSSLFTLTAFCDLNIATLHAACQIYPDVPGYTSLEKLFDDCIDSKGRNLPDCAYVAVPHDQYASVIPLLIEKGIHILKEKPAGSSLPELEHFQTLATTHGVRLVTASQSRYGSRLEYLSSWLAEVGNIISVEGVRKIEVRDLGEGWRARKSSGSGGAVNDLGWHLIDNIMSLLGNEADASIRFAKLFTTRPE